MVRPVPPLAISHKSIDRAQKSSYRSKRGIRLFLCSSVTTAVNVCLVSPRLYCFFSEGTPAMVSEVCFGTSIFVEDYCRIDIV